MLCYTIKYVSKGTQKDDKAEYASVEISIKKMGEDRKYPEPEDDRKEAQRRILRGAFANNADTVVGASMAAHLVRWGTRFYMSHATVPCPVKDLIKLGRNQPVESTATYHLGGEKTYWENQALNYLCRHKALEHLSPFEFFAEYEICHVKLPKATKKRGSNGNAIQPQDDCLKEGKYRFQVDTGFYKHPSVLKVKEWQCCAKGVKKREEPRIVAVSQWWFPDTKKFKADIMTCTENCMNFEMENYAEIVLHLFVDYRDSSELRDENTTRFPYTKRLQEVWDLDLSTNEDAKLLFTEKRMTYLQNVQNAAYNSLRYKLGEDALQRVTKPFCGDCPDLVDEDVFDEDEEDIEELPEDDYNHLMEQIAPDERDNFDEDPSMIPAKMQNFSFKFQRHKGKNGCGYDDTLNEATSILETLDNGELEPVPEDFVNYGVAIPLPPPAADTQNPKQRVQTFVKTDCEGIVNENEHACTRQSF